MSDSDHASSSLHGVRILVIDSNGPSARLICAVLENEGCVLRTACSGHEALAMVEELRPALVLMELVLPDVSGLELVRALKTHAAVGNAAIVAITTSNGPETRRSALEAGCTDYVGKPIDALSFAARVRSHLGRHVESLRATSERGSEEA